MADTKPVTLNDVARASGVSYQTVSRVVNHHPHVATETRKRVLKVIERLGYQPNTAARRLVTGRSDMIGIVSYGTSFYGPSQMVANIEVSLRAHGFGLVISSITIITFEELRIAVSYLKGQLVDGLVIIAPITDIELDRVRELCGNTPFVMVDLEQNGEQGSVVPSVTIDQRYGSQLATRHLIELGHRELTEISGPLHWHDARSRHQAFLKALEEADLEPRSHLESDWSAEGGYRSAKRLLAEGERFTGLVVGNDQMALGAIYALREDGLEIPRDVSIVGFDDVPESAFYTPSLTTVRQDFAALGTHSVEYLVSLLKDPDTPLHQRQLYPTLIRRDSTAAPP